MPFMPQRDAENPSQVRCTFRPSDNSPFGRHFTRISLLCRKSTLLLRGMKF